MIENKELYTYIVHSLDVLNRSIIISEQNTIKLFSYIYNNQVMLQNNIDNLSNNFSELQNTNNNYKKHIDKLESYILTFTDNIKNYENEIKKIDNLEKYIKDYNETVIEIPIITKQDENIFIRFYNYSKKKLNKIYRKCYKILFKKKILKRIEEQRKAFQEKLKEKQNKEILEKKRRIKEILNINRKRK